MNDSFTEGRILSPLLRFSAPVFLALLLQAMYGAVDLYVIGRFCTAAEVSAVSTGSQIMMTITEVIVGFSVGTTVLVGQKIGAGRHEEAADAIGAGICLFSAMALVVTGVMLAAASPLSALMQAPEEAFAETVEYTRICSAGTVFIVAYNVFGSIFRGLGDSRTPLITVLIACVCNIFGDLFFVAVLKMAVAGVAIATVLSQGISVAASLLILKKRGMPFPFSLKNVRFNREYIAGTLKLGSPLALQDGLVSVSFLAILAILNGMGLMASAGVGVAEKVCAFIMLAPSAFGQSMSAFVAQNIGAEKPARAKKALLCGMAVSFLSGIFMFWLSFFHGEALCGIFTRDPEVAAAGASYLCSYAIDTLLVPFLFCFGGYFNGCGKTVFVMAQGIVGAFGVRIPASLLLSRTAGATLFRVGLATPMSTLVQITMCLIYFFTQEKKARRTLPAPAQ